MASARTGNRTEKHNVKAAVKKIYHLKSLKMIVVMLNLKSGDTSGLLAAMASDEETKSSLEENFEWNVENEIRLFEAMIGHKPVGINKHFHMVCISEKFENLIGKPVPSDIIWKHLGNMFDLAALVICWSYLVQDKKEMLPFPNEPVEFSLPEAEFSDLINEKLALKTESLVESKENSKELKTSAKVVKDSNHSKDSERGKKEKKSDTEETGSSNEGDKKESVESESESKRGKISKEEKPVKRRGNRSAKEKKLEEDTPQTPTSVKKEEESSSVGNSHKKEKQGVGKRSLRSRADDSLSSKSLTPPPTKRARRI